MSKNLHNRNYLCSCLKTAGVIAATAVFSATSYAAPPLGAVSYASFEMESRKQVTVTGTVRDAAGVPLQGVSIRLKDGTTGTTTNSNGAYSIVLPAGNQTLTFSFVGFTTQELAVGNKTVLDVTLREGTAGLDEIVVIGYGTARRRDLTGSVSSVKAEDIVRSPVSNAMEALQGRVAGLDIQRSSGRAGQNPAVLLRGNRSLLPDNNNPLYVIDGVMGASIDDINPNDIESIDVLKDASSTSIYGAAGGNGVIMITTKRGVAGKMSIDFNTYYGKNGFATFPKPVMREQWISYMNDRYFADNKKFPASILDLNLTVPVRDAVDAGQWVDWIDESLQTGTQQNHHVSLRGGSEKVQGFMTFGHINEKGIYKYDQTRAYNGRGGVDFRFNRVLKAGLQTTLNWSNGNATNSRVNQAYSLAPVGTPYNTDGSIKLRPLGDDVSVVSPLANMAPGVWVDNDKDFYIIVNPYLELNPLENLTVRSNFSANFASNRNGTFANERSFNIASENRNVKEARYESTLSQNLVWENVVTYYFAIKEDHRFTATGITSMRKSKRENAFAGGQGVDYDEFLFYNIGNVKTLSAGSSYTDRSDFGFAGRINYNYKSKYLLTGSVRRDGTSVLVKKWDTFPSFAAAWVLSEEGFMKSTKSWLSNLKLRGSWGIAGTSGIPANSRTTEVVSKTGTPITLGGSALLPTFVLKQTLGNADLTWEKAHTTNLGIDALFFKNRIEANLDWYHTTTKGVFYERKLPFASGGFDAKNAYEIIGNIATSENRGWEVTLNTKNVVNSDFQWSSAFTYTKYKEKLLQIDLGNSLTPAELISENLFLGHPLQNIYGYKKIGIWQLGEEEEATKYGARPGDIKLATVPRFDASGVSDNGVHPYGPTDRMLIGQRNPEWTLGFQNTFNYKGFDLTIYMLMRYGQYIDAPILGYYNRLAQPSSYNYWTPNNPTNDFPQPYLTAAGINATYQSALQIVNGSYMKIKNITLGYNIPKDFGQKIGLSRLRVYGTAYNPFIYAKSKMLRDVDPETGGADTFPLFKQIVFGLNASF